MGIEPTTSGLDLCRPRSSVGRVTVDLNPEVVGSIPTEIKIIFFFTSCGSLIPFTRANAQWVFYGFHIAL